MSLLRCNRGILISHALLLLALPCQAEDWPQWRGTNRDGIWSETDVLQTFPPDGLQVLWRAPVGGGFSSPVVAQGRVYITDSKLEKPLAWERVQCFDEKTGQMLWTHQYQVKYVDWAFDPKNPAGPGSTPIVKDGKIYSLGAAGDLFCLDVSNGAVLWKKNTSEEFGLKDLSGSTPSPLIEGDLLILIVGGKPDAGVVAFNKNSGAEVWRSLADQWTYSSPIVITAGGQRQLIVWTPQAITSLNPATGKIHWREPISLGGDYYAIATPVVRGDLLLLSGLMFRLDLDKPSASVLWPETKALSRRILSRTSIPLIQDGYVYSDKTDGHLVCLDQETGKQVWENDSVTDHKSGSAIQIIPNGDSVLLYTNEGNLIRSHLTPKGYEELSRAHLIDPTLLFAGRKVAWSPPTFANRRVFVRNDKELICASLAAPPGSTSHPSPQ